jgi:hypothetical protein
MTPFKCFLRLFPDILFIRVGCCSFCQSLLDDIDWGMNRKLLVLEIVIRRSAIFIDFFSSSVGIPAVSFNSL